MLKSRQWAWTAIRVLVPIAIFVWLFRSISPDDWRTLRDQPKNWPILAAAIASAIIAVVFSFARWLLLVRAVSIPFSLKESLQLGFLGYLFNFISPGSVGGDVFKAIAIAKNKPNSRLEAVASVLVDRAIGLYGLIVLSSFSLVFLPPDPMSDAFRWVRQGTITLFLVGIFGLLVAVIGGPLFDKLVRICLRVPWIGSPLARIANVSKIFHRRPLLALVVVMMSVMIHVLFTLSVFLTSAALYPEHPTVVEHMLVIPTGLAAGALPIAPAGVGVQEFAFTALFKELPTLPEGYSPPIVAVAYRLITFLVAGIGVVYYWASRRTVVDSNSPSSRQEVDFDRSIGTFR